MLSLTCSFFSASFLFQCKPHPEPALYNGGVLRWASKITDFRTEDEGNYSPAFVLYNMSAAMAYSFSCKSLPTLYHYCCSCAVDSKERDNL